MPHASVNGIRLYYEERGSGVPILGVHGAGSSAVFWESAAERLAAHGRVITYDRRGSNRSELPEVYESTTVRAHADDALGLLRALDAAPAIVVGRSYGATIALDLALCQPESVVGVALLEAGPLGLDAEYDAWFDRLRSAAESVPMEQVGEVVMREVFGAWEELPDEWRDLFTRNGQGLAAELRGGERTDNDRFGELRVPALVVTASDSPEAIRRCSQALADALPGARAVTVGGGHAIDPAGEEVAAFVRELIDTTARH
jgi:pimeloyl-ACP methyl ester carboxylesterase